MQSQEIQKLRVDEKEQVQHQPEKPPLHLVEIREEITVSEKIDIKYIKKRAEITAVSYLWCRICKQKTPFNEARGCDCGVIMCNNCWGEWDSTCPMCESGMTTAFVPK
ncbi:MAG: hypothetical protein CVU89_14635 [Firmicutes bacterium HGW-Firmicutes-14]|jgi:hypothetical protein|nr:MAG: hypothetical protein CVU89_14635 [Firmicutes bacterium HGW-Firmicutes-14]